MGLFIVQIGIKIQIDFVPLLSFFACVKDFLPSLVHSSDHGVTFCTIIIN